MTMDNVHIEDEDEEEKEGPEEATIEVEELPNPSIAERIGRAGKATGEAVGGAANVVVRRTAEEVYPEQKESGGDDMRDLFKAPDPDDPDMKVDDVIEVTEEDVFGDGGADMDDIVGVTDEDVMGEGDANMSDDVLSPGESEDLSDVLGTEPLPPPKKKVVRKYKRTNLRYPPASGMQGMR